MGSSTCAKVAGKAPMKFSFLFQFYFLFSKMVSTQHG
jgi:hypothetical protein